MYPSSTPNIDVKIAMKKIDKAKGEATQEEIEELKKKSDKYCSNCLTAKDEYLVPGAGIFCNCGAQDFIENGEEEYPNIWEKHKDTIDALKNDIDWEK